MQRIFVIVETFFCSIRPLQETLSAAKTQGTYDGVDANFGAYSQMVGRIDLEFKFLTCQRKKTENSVVIRQRRCHEANSMCIIQGKNDIYALESSSEPLSYQHVACIAENPPNKRSLQRLKS
jgi:hypothetical protein